MRYGLHAAFHHESVDLPEFAALCEKLGYESIWLPEHTVIPVNPTVGPGGVKGAPIPDSYAVQADQVVGLSIVAASTKTLRLGTGVCLIPEHHPIDLAKRISTLDMYSHGRVVLGIGAGWQPEESAALGGDFPRRWAQTNESMRIMRKLWTEERPEHDGDYYSFPPVRFFPKPAQKPGPPVLLGGTSQRVFERAAEYGDGWIPWMVPAEKVAAGRDDLRRAFESAGRDPDSAQVTVFASAPDKDLAAAYENAGVDRIVFVIGTEPEADPAGTIERIAREIGI